MEAAILRAVHQDLDGGLIFRDPLAWHILGIDPFERTEIVLESRNLDRPAERIFVAVRHRFAEDAVSEAVLRDTNQVVVLAAGLSTFAYRHTYGDLAVFEVDDAKASQAKQFRLANAMIPIPPGVRYVAAADGLLAALLDAGLALRPTTVIWLGEVERLDPDQVRDTLSEIARIPGSEVVFDYPIGEWEPDRVQAMLRDLGFDEIEDLGPVDITKRYLRRGVLRERASGEGHVVRARQTRWSTGS